MHSKYYTVKDVAEMLNLTVTTVNRWCRAGRFSGARLRLGSPALGWQIPRDVVDSLLEEYGEQKGPEPLPGELERDQPAHPTKPCKQPV